MIVPERYQSVSTSLRAYHNNIIVVPLVSVVINFFCVEKMNSFTGKRVINHTLNTQRIIQTNENDLIILTISDHKTQSGSFRIWRI